MGFSTAHPRSNRLGARLGEGAESRLGLSAWSVSARCGTTACMRSKASRSHSIYLNMDSDFFVNYPGSELMRRLTSDRNNTGIQQRPRRRQQMINSSLQAFAN